MSTRSHLVYDGDSGRWQYVIGTGEQTKKYSLVQVDYLIDLQRLPDRTSLVQVKHAYLDDPTVDVGWAIYWFDADEKAWMKVAEEESMDVPPQGVLPDDFEDTYATYEYVDQQDKIVKDMAVANSGRITNIENYLKDCTNELNALDALIG